MTSDDDFRRTQRFGWILYSSGWCVGTAFMASVSFTGWPLSSHPAAMSTMGAAMGTGVLSLLMGGLLLSILLSDAQRHKRVTSCAHTERVVTTTCTNCGTVLDKRKERD